MYRRLFREKFPRQFPHVVVEQIPFILIQRPFFRKQTLTCTSVGCDLLADMAHDSATLVRDGMLLSIFS